jgi:hypothetical protein
MTTAELHKILDDENCKLTVKELKQTIYELKRDVTNKSYEKLNDEIMCELQANKLAAQREYQFYTGEANAFMICLDLLEHLKEG